MNSLHIDSNKKDLPPIALDYFESNVASDQVVIIVGGSGDTRTNFIDLAEALIKAKLPSNIANFSFRGREENIGYNLGQQVLDLEEVIKYLMTKKGNKGIKLVCTSQGAYSTTWIASTTKYAPFISDIVYLDPADYHLIPDFNLDSKADMTWSGFEDFKPRSNTAANLLNGLGPSTQVSVIHFKLRNHGPEGYSSPLYSERGIDTEEMFPRLNRDMVKNFYDNTPSNNSKTYFEIPGLPHAFLRDGDIAKNTEKIVEVILECLIPKEG